MWSNNRILTLLFGREMLGTEQNIEREDDTKIYDNFLIYFSHNVIPI
jgi:hypothetical protein